MSRRIFKVRYISTKNCFCYLSEHNTTYTAAGAIVLHHDNREAYFTAQTAPVLGENEIGINRTQAELMNITENDDVMVSVIQNVPGIKRLTVSPSSQDDYEILELLAENIQSVLLDQIRVVKLNQKFVIWVSNSLHVIVNVDAIHPVNPGRLDNLTEVEIRPPVSKTILKKEKEITKPLQKTSIFNYFNNRTPDPASIKILEKYSNITPPLCFTLHPLLALSNQPNSNLHFNVYIHRKFLPSNFKNDFYLVDIINPPAEEENIGVINRKFAASLIVLDDINENITTPVMYVHDCIFKNFNIKPGAKVLLDSILQSRPVINKIELVVKSKARMNIVEAFREFLFDVCSKAPLLLNSNFIININNDFCMLKFYPICDYGIVTLQAIKNYSIVVSEFELTLPDTDTIPQNKFCELYSSSKEIVENAVLCLTNGFYDGGVSENVLITGKPGTGKTGLTKIIMGRLKSHPLYIYTEVIACKTVKGKTVESLNKVLSKALLNLVYYQPSVLILDDLHVICRKVAEEETLTQESLHSNRVSEMIANILETLKTKQITVLATSESTFQLNHNIFLPRGLHLFKNVVTIKNLVKDDREQIIKHLISESCKSYDVDLNELAIKTEGFVIQDMVDFIHKAMFECLKELPDVPKITMLHCDVALKNTVTLSLQDVQLHSPGERDFSDIGGLEDVKKVLVESMLWPLKYPQIFEKAPLRLQSGLLLYGPPGTGKTILAGAAAKEFGLRLISVKGPELLSKYIGASEQAVRNIFEKAQNAKPCILFFDEFDSLAPRRGHDSTGVTDRVVNQLLTQLDGIESLNGVCVLAATSRPDLLDPALLRPGRLDKQLLCPLPEKECRLEILKSLSKKLVLKNDVDLSVIANNTVGFSGADLQAVLYTAQLSVVQEVTDRIEGDMPDAIEINQNHLENALKTTRPSLSKQEITKYEKIYAKFEKGGAGDLQSGRQRATLA